MFLSVLSSFNVIAIIIRLWCVARIKNDSGLHIRSSPDTGAQLLDRGDDWMKSDFRCVGFFPRRAPS